MVDELKDNISLKVAEANQDDINKGVVRIDSSHMREIGIRPGNIVEIEGEGRTTVAIADRALPGDIGLPIIRMDGLIRRNAKTTIGENVKVKKADVIEAKKVTIAPARKGIMVRANPQIFKRGLFGRAVLKGDIVSLGGSRRRRTAFEGNPFFDEMDPFSSFVGESMYNFGLGDLKFVVVDVQPAKKAVLITDNTQVIFNPEAVELKETEGKGLDVTYEDIGGLKEELHKVREMVELPLKHPEIFERLGIEPPKGVLLHGPPGTGKTLLAKAVANETNSSFYLINGPEIMSKYYGQSEENLRKKFEEAEKNAPSIIFIDEIDAIASKREESKGEVERRVVAQMLAIMDGLKSRGKVVVIAATNIPNSLDPALRRPGRFDRELEIGVPQAEGRHKILQIHTRNMPLEGELHFDLLKEEFEERVKNYISKEKNHEYRQLVQQINNTKSKTKQVNKELEETVEQIELLEAKKKKDPTLIEEIIRRISGEKSKQQDFLKQKNRLEEDLELLQAKEKTLTKKIDDFKKKHEEIEKGVDATRDILNQAMIFEKEKKTFGDQRDVLIKRFNDKKVQEYVSMCIDLGFIDDPMFTSVKRKPEAINRLLQKFSSTTHGFVGADLSSLAREAAMIVIRRIVPDLSVKDETEIPKETLEKLFITQEDFLEALKTVRPSAMREVLIEIPDIKWSDIGGLQNVQQELREAVEWPLKHKDAFEKLGVKPPKGILLYGPPGTGKTLLAKAVANESEANFILINGPELLSKWVGESEKAVRKIFEKARQTSPTIIFFDEMDSIASRRGGEGSDNKVAERVVNQLLTEIDGIQENTDVVVIAATNRPDIIDPALLRPGRFDRITLVGAPDKESRKKIFEVHTKGMPLENSIQIDELATKTQGYSGADIEAICREAAILTLRKDMKSEIVTKESFEQALEKVGPSITKEIEKAYEELKDQFRRAQGNSLREDKPSYYG